MDAAPLSIDERIRIAREPIQITVIGSHYYYSGTVLNATGDGRRPFIIPEGYFDGDRRAEQED